MPVQRGSIGTTMALQLKPLFNYSVAVLGLSLGVPACNKSHCDDVTDKDFAVKFVIPGDDECQHTGTVVRKEESGDVTDELSCAVEDGYCTCRGGDEFGTYDVYFENSQSGETEYMEVVAEPNSSVCVERTSSGFTVVGDGGAGGIGGSN